MHRFGEALGLLRDLLLLVARKSGKGVKLGADEERDRSLRSSGFVSQSKRWGKSKRTLLNPRAWRYHSLTELSVDFRERSNMNRIATASLQTSGSMFTNSRCPPRSQMENVMVVRRTEIVFSMKLTPDNDCKERKTDQRNRKQVPSVCI